jgi:hypothetical protein
MRDYLQTMHTLYECRLFGNLPVPQDVNGVVLNQDGL